MPGKDQSWDESWQKKGNRGIVLTDVPGSQLYLQLHSVALAPRLSYPLIVGNLLLIKGAMPMYGNYNNCLHLGSHSLHIVADNVAEIPLTLLGTSLNEL